MSDKEHIQQMSDLLKSGATMLEDHCPVCSSPLFKVEGKIWCPQCQKRVIITKEKDEALVTASSFLNDVERMLLLKIQESSEQIMKEKDTIHLERWSSLLAKWLEALERVRRIKTI